MALSKASRAAVIIPRRWHQQSQNVEELLPRVRPAYLICPSSQHLGLPMQVNTKLTSSKQRLPYPRLLPQMKPRASREASNVHGTHPKQVATEIGLPTD
mmetsp:Transcript_53968/g.148863  ORF Transcript_53968/g.148863 Transcript_53968/m.148863 type:complete len:99 (-) Transcript_53968:470-766(-)